MQLTITAHKTDGFEMAVTDQHTAVLTKLPFVVIDDENCHNRHILRQSSQEVPFPLSNQHKQFALMLMKRMINEDGCVGLAAPMIGQSWRMIVVQVTADLYNKRQDIETLITPTILINPSYQPIGDEKQVDWEASFSIDKQMGKVRRYQHIQYQGWDLEGHRLSGKATGLLARVIQHEIDYLDGRLIIDLFEDDLPHGPKDEMRLLRDQEFANNTAIKG